MKFKNKKQRVAKLYKERLIRMQMFILILFCFFVLCKSETNVKKIKYVRTMFKCIEKLGKMAVRNQNAIPKNFSNSSTSNGLPANNNNTLASITDNNTSQTTVTSNNLNNDNTSTTTTNVSPVTTPQQIITPQHQITQHHNIISKNFIDGQGTVPGPLPNNNIELIYDSCVVHISKTNDSTLMTLATNTQYQPGQGGQTEHSINLLYQKCKNCLDSQITNKPCLRACADKEYICESFNTHYFDETINYNTNRFRYFDYEKDTKILGRQPRIKISDTDNSGKTKAQYIVNFDDKFKITSKQMEDMKFDSNQQELHTKKKAEINQLKNKILAKNKTKMLDYEEPNE